MIGIIILLVLVVWFFVAKKLAWFCTHKMQTGTKKILVHIVLFVLFFIGPVTDEIIGRIQLQVLLCTPKNMLVYDETIVRGKSLQFKNVPDKSIKKILSIQQVVSEWVDPNTGEVFITYRRYFSEGGWLSRLLYMGNPLTFTGVCRSKEYYELFKKLDVKQLKGYYGEEE